MDTPPRANLTVFGDRNALAEAAATRVIALAQRAIGARGRFAWALSGGSTPRPVYERLAKAPLDWSRVHFFWGDERCVPPDAPESNYRMAREALLRAIPVPAENVHRMRGEDDPAQAASAYEELLRRWFDVPSKAPPPSFDLVVLGMGADGHTASLFPGTPAVHERQRWVLANRGPEPSPFRLTLTPVLLDAAAHILVLVAGADKAGTLRRVLGPAADGAELPVQRIRPIDGELEWMADAAAAAQLGSP